MTIKQARVSTSIPHYQERFHRRHVLRPYTNAFIPTFFFGCYSSDDLFALSWHQGIAVVIWAGSDAMNLKRLRGIPSAWHILTRPNVRHVAISSFIANDLAEVGLPFKRVPFCNVDMEKFKPVPRGKAVYCYCPDGNGEKYGASLLAEVMAALPDVEFIVQRTLDPNADMAALYARAGVVLRLTGHDGLSNTCVEAGLMGRRAIWNGDTPNAIPYESAEDIVEVIKEELGLVEAAA